ncbi:MAG TPA: hypothetical protein VNA25_19535 [Phycisphaerae bacterium]|nr:hypothetical protein [Phycisphaerae bacterium]
MSKKTKTDGYGSAGGGPRQKNSTKSSSDSYAPSGGAAMGEVGYSGSMSNVVSANTGSAGSVSIRGGGRASFPKKGPTPARG